MHLSSEAQSLKERFSSLQAELQSFLVLALYMGKAVVFEHDLAQNVGDAKLTEQVPGVLKATFGSDYSHVDGRCFPGTREVFLKEMMDWATAEDNSEGMLWLCGYPGAGKTTIAATFADQLSQREMLGGTFFCKRTDPERRAPGNVLVSLAVWLKSVWPDFSNKIKSLLESDEKRQIPTMSMETHFKELFHNILPNLSTLGQKTCILIVDALDECGTQKSRALLLKNLCALSQLTPKLKVCITSRAYSDISDALSNCKNWIDTARPHVCTMVATPDDTAADSDILVFLKHEFYCIGEAIGNTKWADSSDTDRLAIQCQGLFQSARLSLDFIKEHFGIQPQRGLQKLLSKEKVQQGQTELDMLYHLIIGEAVVGLKENTHLVKQVLGVMIALINHGQVNTEALVMLGGLKYEISTVQTLIKKLHIVIACDAKTGNLTFHHQSFPDFVQTKARSRQFWSPAFAYHSDVAENSIAIMHRELKFNICNIQTSHQANSDIPDLLDKILKHIPLPLHYACLYVTHFFNPWNEFQNQKLADVFCTEQALFWLEVLSLIEEPASGRYTLEKLLELVGKVRYNVFFLEGAYKKYSRRTDQK